MVSISTRWVSVARLPSRARVGTLIPKAEARLGKSGREHKVDLQNLAVHAKGMAKAKAAVKGVTVGDGPNSLFHPQGTSIVIHAYPDDMKTDPSGNAGARIACGVVTK